jgi:MinD superfamily P-loop ATPase
MTEEDMQFNEKSQMDCGNCFTAIPNEVLVDAGELFFLGDYDCENCGEPLN